MTTTAAQIITKGATVTLAGRAFTVDTVYSHIVLLMSDHGTGYIVARNAGHPVRVNSLGSTLRKDGRPVLVRVANDMITEVA